MNLGFGALHGMFFAACGVNSAMGVVIESPDLTLNLIKVATT
jgi:hypothetical protein